MVERTEFVVELKLAGTVTNVALAKIAPAAVDVVPAFCRLVAFLIVTFFKLTQFKNALVPIVVTVLGIVTDCNAVPLNA